MSQNESGLICLVSVIKDEDLFIDEWLAYHKLIGIDHFYLYDDSPDFSLSGVMAAHDRVTLLNWHKNFEAENGVKKQIAAFRHAFENYIKNFEWVVFLDVDEYIVLKKHTCIADLLSVYHQASALSLKWHLFGHNGFWDDTDRLVTSSLNRRRYEPSHEVKTITRTGLIQGISSPHYCELKSGDREIIDNEPDGVESIAFINHYQCRSFNRWMRRVSRGDVNFNPLNATEEHLWRFDDDACIKRFVTTIAKDHNEYTDNFMLQYRFAIQQSLNSLNIYRRKQQYASLLKPLDMRIGLMLSNLAELVMEHHHVVGAVDINAGRVGLVIFLSHYANYTHNTVLKAQAKHMLEDIADNITPGMSVGFSDGLTGFGFAVEHLVRSSFLQIDTNNYLEDVDDLINYNIIQQGNELWHTPGLVSAIAKYFTARLRNPFNDHWHHREIKNKDIIKTLVKTFEGKENSLADIADIVDLYECALLVQDDFPLIKSNIVSMAIAAELKFNHGTLNGALSPQALYALKFAELTGATAYMETVVKYLSDSIFGFTATNNAVLTMGNIRNLIIYLHYAQQALLDVSKMKEMIDCVLQKCEDSIKTLKGMAPGNITATDILQLNAAGLFFLTLNGELDIKQLSRLYF